MEDEGMSALLLSNERDAAAEAGRSHRVTYGSAGDNNNGNNNNNNGYSYQSVNDSDEVDGGNEHTALIGGGGKERMLSSFVGLRPDVRHTWVIELVTFLYAMSLFAMFSGSTQLIQKLICEIKKRELEPIHPNNSSSSGLSSSGYDDIDSFSNFGKGKNSTDFCNTAAVTGPTADQMLYFQLASIIPALFTVPYFASVADHTGRRKGVIIACLGALVQATGYLALEVQRFDLAWNYIPQVISGLCGTIGLMLMAVFAAFADITTVQTRAFRVATGEAALILGGAIGAIAGGLINKHYGFRTFLSVNAIVAFFPLVIAIFFFPETLPPQPPKKVTWREANVVAAMGIFLRSVPMFFLAVTLTVYLSVLFGWPNVQVLFFKHRFDWHEDTIGYMSASQTGCRGIGLAVVLPLTLNLARRCGFPLSVTQAALSQFSCAVFIVSALLWAFVDNPVWAFLFTLLNLLAAWTVPLARVICSTLVDAREQGVLFGAIAVLEACFSPLIGFSVLGKVYSHTAESAPATVFYVSAGFIAFTMVTLGIFQLFHRPEDIRFKPPTINTLS